MSSPLLKALRDFTREKTRTTFVVLAVALGIAGFTAVLSAYAILTRELNAGYLATNPASVIFRLDRVDPETLAAVRAIPAVGAAEARRTLNARIRSGPAQWRPLVLFVVDDFAKIQISRLVPQQGAWPPAPGEILIERDALQVIHANIGDAVTVRTNKGQELTLRATGTVHDVGQAQARMENLVYAYTTLATLEKLGEQPFLDQLLIQVSADRFNEAHIRDVAATVSQRLESLGHAPRRVDIPPPGKHPHADIISLLLLAMSAFGLCVLALSGILVVNLVTGLMAQQIPQIGVMKAIGASPTQIARIYLFQTALMGLAAVAAGLLPGLLGGRALCRYMAVFLNFDMTSMSVPLWVFALVPLAGIAVPLLAAVFPVSRACEIPVRLALVESGMAPGHFGQTRLDRALARATGPRRPLLLALRDGFRRPTRFLLTVATLAAAGIFFMSALNTRASLIYTLDKLFQARRYDLSVSVAGMASLEKVEHALRQAPGLVRYEGWMTLEASLPDKAEPAPKSAAGHGGGAAASMHGAGAPGGGRTFTAIALPPDSAVLDFRYVAGRGLNTSGNDEVVVNTALAARYPQMKPGAVIPVQLGPALLNLKVVGIAREAFSPPVAYVSRPWLENKGGHPPMANSLRAALANSSEASLQRTRAELETRLAAEGIRVTGSSTTADGRVGFDLHMVMIYVFLVIVSCILAGVGGLGLATSLSLNVLERRREMGVLRTIGATPRAVYAIVLTEGLATGLIAWAAATLLAWPVSAAIGNLLAKAMFQSALDFSFEFKGVLIWLAASVALSAAASLLPAWQASKLTIREALARS